MWQNQDMVIFYKVFVHFSQLVSFKVSWLILTVSCIPGDKLPICWLATLCSGHAWWVAPGLCYAIQAAKERNCQNCIAKQFLQSEGYKISNNRSVFTPLYCILSYLESFVSICTANIFRQKLFFCLAMNYFSY